MPYVRVAVAGPLSRDQKSAIADRVSSALEEIAGKSRAATYVVFEEIPRESWAVGGELLADKDTRTKP